MLGNEQAMPSRALVASLSCGAYNCWMLMVLVALVAHGGIIKTSCPHQTKVAGRGPPQHASEQGGHHSQPEHCSPEDR